MKNFSYDPELAAKITELGHRYVEEILKTNSEILSHSPVSIKTIEYKSGNRKAELKRII